MKSPIYFLFFITLFFVCQTSFGQENFEKTKIVTNVFKALKKQKVKIFLKSLPTKDEITYLIPIGHATQPDKEIPDVNIIISNFKRDASENFRKVIKKGNDFGIEWKDIIIQKVRYDANPDSGIEIERGDITLVCKSNDKKFLIVIRKTYKIRDTWRLMNRMKLTLL
ncbi:hypothetical protein QWY81_00620 [Polaribacter undariae]|uniref:Uncharacterized protein n=1 Tax=Polaribacter sejongensis TaxID=985043 RepID=A0AAJ1VEG9_9FLAO|nr:hypothetical protein [Polaribacter undariae]MDN3617951.1 hypothetical protein [Polaribacter undariae]UWD32017.1 hypothetical protein NQP51_18045 [Polaribacter undariae]